jgi:carbonic anhydrase
MRKLIQGIVAFRKSLTVQRKNHFLDLALGQKPDALFIGCSDSRVMPNCFASVDPGDLFVLRNIGNLAPPASVSPMDSSVQAAVEFSLSSLMVSDIIVCGHSECGAMQALTKGVETLACPHLRSWLQYGKESLDRVRKGFVIDSSLSEHNQVSQVNVLQQIEHLYTYPGVRERVEKQQLQIHGWWFDIARADVYCYEEGRGQFVLIDEKEAGLIQSRMG